MIPRSLWRLGALLIGCCAAIGCQPDLPAMTGITITPATADGLPDAVNLARTVLGPPIPVIGVRPGSQPERNALFLNEPISGRLFVTFGRGPQSFLLFTASSAKGHDYVVAVFLDGELTPCLSAIVSDAAPAALRASTAPDIMGLSGVAVSNATSLSAIRRGYRVTLHSARFPLADLRLDVVGPWTLRPDGVADSVGVISLDVQSLTAQS